VIGVSELAGRSEISQPEISTRRTWLGHPVGLVNLFGVELWERFSFYGMLTILGYYLYYSVTDGGLGLPKATAGLAFLAFMAMAGTSGRSVPVLFVVVVMAGFAISELLLSPIGLSVTTQLAPEAFRAQMMALYFFSVGLGTAMSGVLARYYDPAHEFAYFGIIGSVAVVIGAVVWVLAPRISALMDGVH